MLSKLASIMPRSTRSSLKRNAAPPSDDAPPKEEEAAATPKLAKKPAAASSTAKKKSAAQALSNLFEGKEGSGKSDAVSDLMSAEASAPGFASPRKKAKKGSGGGGKKAPAPKGGGAVAVPKLPAATPQRAAGAAALAAMGSKDGSGVGVPALPPVAEAGQDYMMQNLVHATKVTSPLPMGRGRKPGPGGFLPVGPPPPGVPLPPGAVPLPPGAMPGPPPPPSKSRKEKSLGVLCANFMELFKDAPPNRDNNGTVIEIQQVADHLGVKRRRIYDVINILESIDIVCRVKKNTYRWHGKENLPRFFAELQRAGLEEQASRQAVAAAAAAAVAAQGGPDAKPAAEVVLPGKTKGMAQTCQRLVQIFLVSGRTDIGLNEAAEEVLGPLSPSEEANSQRAMKTKVRRMYDIANVLQSIGILRKENVGSTSLQNKPSFKWTFEVPPSEMGQYLNPDAPRPVLLRLAPVRVDAASAAAAAALPVPADPTSVTAEQAKVAEAVAAEAVAAVAAAELHQV